MEEVDEHLRDPPGESLGGAGAAGTPTAERSKQVAASEFPDDILWIRSYEISEPGGTLGTVCIYQASGIEAVRQHAARVDMPADEILEVVDTVVIRPDPQPLDAGAS
ncbi:MAG: DUF4242 domain-containing protein [Solirubrobacterales bacterium]